jgi:integrase
MDASSVLRVLVAGGRSVNSPHILSRLRFRPAHAHMLLTSSQTMATTRARSRPIQAYLGHHNIQNTTRYTALAPQRFKEFFRD